MNYKEIIKEIVSSVGYQPSSFLEIKDIIINKYEVDVDDEILKNDLLDLVNEYDIFLNKKKDKYLSNRLANKYKGYISIRHQDYGFVSNPYYPDFYVDCEDFNTALDKDFVLYQVLEDRFGASGYKAIILNIIKRNYEYLVGELYFKNNKYYLKCNDKRIIKPVIVNLVKKAKSKDIVRVKINSYGEVLKSEVVDILGDSNTIGIDISSIAARYGVLREFSNEVISEVNEIEIDLDIERKRRKTYSDNIYTIDGLDAKDLDDAVSLKKLDNGNYKLGVYIADVSYYVTKDSKVDVEALKRGTSVYLLDRVIPMLPVRLSNDLCSLNPNEEKLVISCIMEIDTSGNVITSSLEEGIIKTTKRLNYQDCNKVLEEGYIEEVGYSLDLIDNLKLMVELKDILKEKRNRRGSIDFDTVEPKIILNESGEAIDIIPIERGISEQIIEEFMIVCNETVAEFISNLDLPFIYRIHDKPDNIKFQMLKSMVSKLGYKLLGLYPKELQKLLNALDSKDNYIKNSMLRLMAKAVYSEENIGHFGLASRFYTHFTSPIRRYPDLLVHRLIRMYIFNNQNLLSDDEYRLLKDEIAKIALTSSNCERSAMECEFAVNDMKKAEYMSSFIGSIYEGIVTSIHKFGIFVTLPNTVDGLIRADNLRINGFYFDNYSNVYVNKTSKKISLGETLKVRLINSNKKTSEIDFELVYNNRGVSRYGKYKGYLKK